MPLAWLPVSPLLLFNRKCLSLIVRYTRTDIYHSSDVCETGLSTIFVTGPQVTVTVHAAQTKTATVYLTAPSGDVLPTTTITRVYTISSTTTEPYVDTVDLPRTASTSGVVAAVSTPVSYETTITQVSSCQLL